MSVRDNLDRLVQTKYDKISSLSTKESPIFSDNSFDNSFSDVGDGYIKYNDNKLEGVLNDTTPQERAFLRDHVLENYNLPDTTRELSRRLYGFFTGTSGSEEAPLYDPAKIGVFNNKSQTADTRFQPELGGYDPGSRGVDLDRKFRDVNLEADAATALEALIHSQDDLFNNRVLRKRTDGYFDYITPEGKIEVIDENTRKELFGSGYTEYYVNRDAIFDDNYDPETIDRERLLGGFEQALDVVRANSAEKGFFPVARKEPDLIDGIENAIRGFGSTFINELVVNPLDAIGDYTGLFDLGTEEEKTQFTNIVTGFDPRAQHEAMERIGAQFDIVADSNASTADRMRAAGEGILEAFSTPEMLGTSLGAILAWFGPGKFLKAFGVGSKYDKVAKTLDLRAKAGTITKAEARRQKLQAFASVEGAKSLLTGQAGMVTSAIGNVNDQYQQFLENNNNQEPEEGKEAWFAGRFFVQMINQNLDKITAFNIIKSKGAIAGLGTAVKSMTQKEFANAAKAMGKGVLKTAENMGQEAAQEYSQTMMELFNSRFGSEMFSDVDTFQKFITDEENVRESGIAALAGAGGAGQFELVGVVTGAAGRGLGTAAGSLGQRIKDAAPTPTDTPISDIVTEEESTPEQRKAQSAEANQSADRVAGKYSGMLGADEFTRLFAALGTSEEDLVDTPTLRANLAKEPGSFRKVHDEIERAETIIEERQGTDQAKKEDLSALKVLRTAKREVYAAHMEDKDHPPLGSGISAEDILEGFHETFENEDEMSDAQKELAEQYRKDNDIPPLRFENLKSFRGQKDASIVHEESVGAGNRSATAYRNRLRTLVNSANPNKKEIAKTVDTINNFLTSQENRKSAFDAVLTQVKADVNNYNNAVKKGKTNAGTEAIKRSLIGRTPVPEYGSYVIVNQSKDGLLRVENDSLAVSDSIGDTIDYLNRIKTRYGSQINDLIGEKVTDDGNGFIVRPSAQQQKSRDLDRNLFTAEKVTKAIVDTASSSKKWKKGGDYASDNRSIINSGDYTSDDVIVLNSTKKSFKKSDPLVKEINKAYRARATIILDPDVRKTNNKALDSVLNRYHFKSVERNGRTVYLPEEIAKPLRAEQKAEKKVKKAKDKIKQNMILAMDLKESLGGVSIDQAVKAGTVTKQAAAIYNKRMELAREEFKDNPQDMRKIFDKTIKEQSKKVTKELLNTALSQGLDSQALEEALSEVEEAARENKVPLTAVTKGRALYEEEIERLRKGETLLKEWNIQAKAAKEGKTDLNTFFKKSVTSPRQVVLNQLEASIGKNKKEVFTYYDGASFQITRNKAEAKRISAKVGDGTFQVLTVDPTNIVDVSRTTPLNTLNAKELRVEGDENIGVNNVIGQSLESFTKTLRAPSLELKGTQNSIIDISNSQATNFIFDTDFNINENFAVAANLALHNFIKNNAYLLQKGKKSKKDIAEILGIDETQLSGKAIKMMQDKGLLWKTAAASAGRDIAGMLGITRKNSDEVDAQAYDALISDMGQTALLMGIQQGILERDNSLNAAAFAKTVLRKSTVEADEVSPGGGAKVLFVQAKPGTEEDITTMTQIAKQAAEVIPDIDINRKEPRFKPSSKERIQDLTKDVHKDLLGLSVPEGSAEAMTELMNTKWTANTTLMSNLVSEENVELVKERLGYILEDSDKFNKLSHDGKDSQKAINRDINRTIDEANWLLRTTDGEQAPPLYFDYFFSKDGRLFVDSNTINPQTDKFFRFLVQPESHTNEFTHRGGVFKINNQDVTDKVHYALAQAFGLSTDKTSTQEIKKFAESVLSKLNSQTKIDNARKGLLENEEGKYQIGDLTLEAEHIAHTWQALDFLEKKGFNRNKKSTFSSAITAEFDAVTSGFGLKALQMPIIGQLHDWLRRTGFFKSNDSLVVGANDSKYTVSMNDFLAGELVDSYETLAGDITDFTFEQMHENRPKEGVITDSEYSKNLWAALSDALPKKTAEGVVDSALRTLFKYPFMLFNYSASIKSIRQNLLAGDLVSGLASDMAELDLNKTDLTDKEQNTKTLMEAFVSGSGTTVAALQKDIRENPLYMVKTVRKGGQKNRNSIDRYLRDMIEASYGVQVENILTDNFKPFLNAQEKVNDAFKAMFEIFSIKLETRLEAARKKGALTAQMQRDIYNDLLEEAPIIKGPLSNMLKEGIGVYDTNTSSPYGFYSGRKASRALLSKEMEQALGQKEIRVIHMVKELAAAVAAGSVNPIHYIDGAVMGETVKNLKKEGVEGVTVVHDATIPPLLGMDKAQRVYNQQTLEVSIGYSFVDEIMKSLNRFTDPSADLSDSKFRTRKVQLRGKKESIPVRDFLFNVRNSFAELANDVNKGRRALYSELNEGAHIMHMAGTAEGVYNVEPGSLTKQIEALPNESYKARAYKPNAKEATEKAEVDKLANAKFCK